MFRLYETEGIRLHVSEIQKGNRVTVSLLHIVIVRLLYGVYRYNFINI
jgi:hypothetical protein